MMFKTPAGLYRRIILLFSVSINLGLLFYFKYSNFFIENLNSVFSVFNLTGVHWTKLILPIGISFYTFESITYAVDVYRGLHKPLVHFWDYQLYIILFPKLIAGPIVRYHEIADQIIDRTLNETIDNKLTGLYRFSLGLAKKIIIANPIGKQADIIFAMNYSTLDIYTAWVGILAYTFQIYFDFSGYTDMAIGMAKMLGFKFPENFNNPYTSRSITEFWRRWHITLSAWMRNYLYIPLGGNRGTSKYRMFFNLGFVFLVSGLWHGASWSFIVWGAYHGMFIILERGWLLKKYDQIGKFLSTFITFLLVIVGWVFFRVENLGDAFIYLKKMFTLHLKNVSFDYEFYVLMVLAGLFAFFAYGPKGKEIQDAVFIDPYTYKRHIVMTIVSVGLLILSVSMISTFGFNPFIYFRF
ncbi:MAG: MBOAT family O-acyltransferase [Saprospiraceae bacterium]